MPVGHREEMRPSVLSQVRQHQEGVLVDFVRVLRRVARLGGEGELRDAVIELLARLPGLHGVLVL